MRETYRTRKVIGTRKKATHALVVWEFLLSCGHSRDFATTKAGTPSKVRCFECGQRAEWRRRESRASSSPERGAS